MTQTSSDFTNTFRILANVKRNELNDSQIIEQLVKICAPVEHLSS